MVRFLGLLALFVIVLVSCSSNKKKEEDKAAELVEFTSTVSMKRLWSVSAGSEKKRKYTRIVPALANDVVYTADTTGKVFAFNAETGKSHWQVDTHLPIAGATGAGFGLVLVGTHDAELVALDAATGTIKWKAEVSSEVISPPATNGSIVVVHTIDGRIFAYDAKTGEQRWSYDHLSPILSLRGVAAPVITTTQVICAFDNGQVVSFSALDGSRIWEARAAQPKGKTDLERIVDIDGAPVLAGGLVYVGSYQGNILALSRAQGKPVWKKTSSTYQRLAAVNGKVFVSTANSKVMTYNAMNGDILWENDQLLNREISAPVPIGNSHIAVTDKEGYMHIISQSDGSFAHRFKPRDNGFKSPVFSTKYAPRFKPKSEGFKSPMLSTKDKLYVLSDNGTLSSYQITE